MRKQLSDTMSQVLQRIVDGYINRAIARELNISYYTVTEYIDRRLPDFFKEEPEFQDDSLPPKVALARIGQRYFEQQKATNVKSLKEIFGEQYLQVIDTTLDDGDWEKAKKMTDIMVDAVKKGIASINAELDRQNSLLIQSAVLQIAILLMEVWQKVHSKQERIVIAKLSYEVLVEEKQNDKHWTNIVCAGIAKAFNKLKDYDLAVEWLSLMDASIYEPNLSFDQSLDIFNVELSTLISERECEIPEEQLAYFQEMLRIAESWSDLAR